MSYKAKIILRIITAILTVIALYLTLHYSGFTPKNVTPVGMKELRDKETKKENVEVTIPKKETPKKTTTTTLKLKLPSIVKDEEGLDSVANDLNYKENKETDIEEIKERLEKL